MTTTDFINAVNIVKSNRLMSVTADAQLKDSFLPLAGNLYPQARINKKIMNGGYKYFGEL